MARFVTGSEVVEVYAQGAVRVDPAIGEAGDLDTAVLTLRHADGCLTVIDNSRRAAYGYDQRVEAFGAEGMATSQNPPAHTGVLLDGHGSHGPTLPYFFVERYLPSYVHQWAAFASYVRSGGTSPVSGADGRGAARHRAGGVAVGARGPAGRRRAGAGLAERGGLALGPEATQLLVHGEQLDAERAPAVAGAERLVSYGTRIGRHVARAGRAGAQRARGRARTRRPPARRAARRPTASPPQQW